MDEKIVIRFLLEDTPVKVQSFTQSEGITFDRPKDASPLNIAFGLQSLLPGRLDPVRLRHDWRSAEFGLDAQVDNGCLILSGSYGDREGLPFGAYDITLEVESLNFRDSQQRLILGKNQSKEVVFHILPDSRRVQLLNNFDPGTAGLIEKSEVDGKAVADWLLSDAPREARKACLLNILTKLAAPPMQRQPRKLLGQHFQRFHFAEVDRVYAVANKLLRKDLDLLVKNKGWVCEGSPKASIHQKVVRDALKRYKADLSGRKLEDFTLTSYRQGGRNSLQIVVAEPLFEHSKVYADLDIDLGNPLWNIEGFVVHLGELLDPGRTDHFKIHEKFQKSELRDFVFYEVMQN